MRAHDRPSSVRICRTLLGFLVFGVSQIVVASPAGACSCVGFSDAEAFDVADVVFVGELVDYTAPKQMKTSADAAIWTFAVEKVFKGEAAQTQLISSPVSGASCGLEIPHEGTFLVFATTEDEFGGERGDDSLLYANLCGGTRAATNGTAPASFGEGAPPPKPGVGAQLATASEIDTLEGDRRRAAAFAAAVPAAGVGVVAAALLLLRRRRRTEP